MINYLNLWTLQGEQVSIPVDGFYQYWGATPHVTRYGTAAVMVSQSGYDTTAEQWNERRELLLIDLETQVILSRETLAPGQWLVPTGDGAAEYVLGTLAGTTLSLQAYDLMPGSSSFSEPVGEAIQLGVSSALADTLDQFWTNLYAASGVGAEGQTASDYLLVGAPGGQNQNVITIHPISGDVVDDAIGTRVGWLSEFFVNGEALWLSVWTGSASAFSAFVPSSGEFSALSGDDYFEARDIALDVSSVVRTEDTVIELRALGLGIPDDAEIWTDMYWAIETLADGWLLVRAEIFPADAALGYEHWMLFDPEGALIAHKAFADGAGLLMRSIDDGEDGAIYFQQIYASGSFPDLLQAVDPAVTVHRIVADSASIKALLDAPAAIETLAGQASVEQVASYSQQQLGQTEPLPAGRIWVLDGYAPLEGDGGALALGTIVELATDQDLSGLLVISRGLEGGGLQTDVVLLPGEVEELFFAPERVADTLLASARTASGVIAFKVDLATAQVSRVDEGLFFNLLEGRNSESFELALSDGPPQWVTLDVDALGGVGAVPAMPSLVALTAKPLVVASSSDFALVQLGYLAADGTTGAILARLEASETGWTVVDATPIDGQVVELDPVFSPGGVLEAVGVVVMDIGNTGLQVSVVEVSSGAVMAPQPIGTLPLETTLDTLNLSPYATITAKFGPEGDALEGPNGEQTFNIAVVLRTEDPQVPAGQSAVEYRSLMFAVTETAEGEVVSAVAIGDTLGLRSLPAYQQSGIVAYEGTRLFDETPNAVVFIGVDGSTVSATVTGSALIAGLAGVDASVAPDQLAARLLEYNPDTQTFLFALREFTDTSFLQQTGRTFLVRLGWEGESAALSHLDTVLLPTGFNGSFDGVRLVPSEHDGALYLALGQELDRGFVPYRAFKVDYTTGSPQAVELAEPGQFLVVEAAYLGPDLPERYGTEGNDTLTAVEGGEALYGLGGNDFIFGGNGNDLIDGGEGDDRLSGGAGADTVIGGGGADRIRYFSPAELAGDTVSGTSAIYFGGDPAPGGDRFTADRIQLFGPGYYDFAAAASISYIDRIDIVADSGRFDVRLTAEMAASADGNGDGGYGDIHVVGYGTAMDSPATTAQLFLDASALTAGQSVVVRGQVGSGVDGLQAFGGLSGDDSIVGGAGADWIHAGAGDDYLYGGDGADTLDGGAGDDVLIGGPGADVYRFGWGSGQDLVYNNGWDDALDTVELGAGIKQADVALTRDLDDLLISLVGSTDSLRVKDHFTSSEPNASKVDRLHFAEDGTVWDLSNFDPTGSVSITGTAIQGQTLTASNTLADLDGLGPISYQWNANGTAINGATGSAYTLTQAEVGKVITVVAGYVDGGGRPESVMSAPTARVGDATELSNLTGLVLTRKGQALPDFEAKLALSTLDQLDLALVQETIELDGSRTLRFALTLDSAEQAFGAFDLALRTEAGVEIVGLTLSDAFASWTSIPNSLSAQQLLVGAFSANPDPASYLSGELALGDLVVRIGADHTGPLRIAVEELALGAAPVQSGVLRYESAEDLGAGQFAFLGLEDGQIDLSFVGSISNIGRSITAQDALEALRLAVRIPSDYSDAYGLISADYNQDGRVTSQDALEILKTSVRMSDAIQPKWVFLSDEADLSALNSRNTGYKDGLTLDSFLASASYNFTAVLLGDVNNSLVFA